MAYLSRHNPATFRGAASPWAQSLANYVAKELVRSRSRAPFITKFGPTGRGMVLVPLIEGDKLTILALYAAKVSARRLDRFAAAASAGLIFELARCWQTLSRAFVIFVLDLTRRRIIKVTDHDATIRAASELSKFRCVDVPELYEFDDALGTTLWDARENWVSEWTRAHVLVCELGEQQGART